MDLRDALNKIEGIVNDRKTPQTDKQESEKQSNSNGGSVNDIIYLITSFFLDILKTPFKIIAKYIKNDIVSAIRKDAKLYAFIMGIMGVLFIFFSVLWLFISVAVGFYFYENGHSILISIVYSITFQTGSFILLATIAFLASKRIKSLKMLKDFKN